MARQCSIIEGRTELYIKAISSRWMSHEVTEKTCRKFRNYRTHQKCIKYLIHFSTYYIVSTGSAVLTTTISIAQVWKPPDVAETHSITNAGQQEVESATPVASALSHVTGSVAINGIALCRHSVRAGLLWKTTPFKASYNSYWFKIYQSKLLYWDNNTR